MTSDEAMPMVPEDVFRRFAAYAATRLHGMMADAVAGNPRSARLSAPDGRAALVVITASDTVAELLLAVLDATHSKESASPDVTCKRPDPESN